MTETEYLVATNRKAISAALMILRDVMKGDEYAVCPSKYNEVMRLLYEIEAAGFSAIPPLKGE